MKICSLRMMSSVSSVNSFVLGLMIGLMVMLHANPRVINATLPKVEGTFLSLSILKQQTFACGWVGTWQCVHFALCIQVLCLGSLRCSFQKKFPENKQERYLHWRGSRCCRRNTGAGPRTTTRRRGRSRPRARSAAGTLPGVEW